MNKWRKRNWIRSAKHYYILLFQQKEQDACFHATRVAEDMEKDYGKKVKHWPLPRGIVEEDVSYWEK